MINKNLKKNGWTEWSKFFKGTQRDPEGKLGKNNSNFFFFNGLFNELSKERNKSYGQLQRVVKIRRQKVKIL